MLALNPKGEYHFDPELNKFLRALRFFPQKGMLEQ